MMNAETIQKAMEEAGYPVSNLLGSKSMYRKRFPKNLVTFNANLFAEGLGKVWWGDIDLTKGRKVLKGIAKTLGVTLYVLSEMEGRFGNEDREDYANAALWDTKNGLSENYRKYFNPKTLKVITYE